MLFTRNGYRGEAHGMKAYYVSAEKMAELEARIPANVAALLAYMPGNEQRKAWFAEYEQRVGKEAADRMRRDVWALMRGRNEQEAA
jgi:hypothetical protein